MSWYDFIIQSAWFARENIISMSVRVRTRRNIKNNLFIFKSGNWKGVAPKIGNTIFRFGVSAITAL